MAVINKVELPSGASYDVSTLSIPFGQVDDTSTATVFTATIDGITELYDGVCVYLKNGVVTSASGWTLDINGLGAKPVYQSMAAAGRTTTIFNVAYTGLFIYNSSRVEGGCWDYFYGFNSNDNTLAYQVRMNQSINEMYSALTRYKICFTMFDGKLLPSTSVSNSTATTKALITESFDPYGAIYYYNTTTGVDAGESPGASYMWLLYPNVDLRYGFNAGTTLVAKDNVYVKCSPQSDGSVKLAGNDCIVQALPNTDDGYVYIYLGKAFDTYRIVLDINHPVYYYKDGAIRLWTNTSNPDMSNYLSKTNTTSYTPSGDYHPATKKYVDDTTKPKDLMVNITSTWDEDTQSNILTADKTFAEVMTAIENGTLVYFTDEYSEGLPFTTQAYAVGPDYINLDSVNLNRTYVYNSDGTIQELPYTPFLLRPELQNVIGGSDAEAGELTKVYNPAKYSHLKGDLIWLLPDIGTTAFPYLVIDDINAGDTINSSNVQRIYLWDYLKDGSTFVITITSTTENDITTYNADKTFIEITDAYNAGKILIAKVNSSLYQLTTIGSTNCRFMLINSLSTATITLEYQTFNTLIIDNSNNVTLINGSLFSREGSINTHPKKSLIAAVNGNYNTTPVTGKLTYSDTAYKAYEINDLFWKDNYTLAKATTNISSGGTLTENTNYVSTTISDELKDIRATHLSKTNTTAYTPIADYNPATKKYVDENITPFITTVVATRVNDVTTYSADKTFTEITNAYNDGKDCICKIGNMILELVQMSGSRIIFALAYTNNFDKKLSTVITIQISNSNEATYALKNIATTQYVDDAVSEGIAQSNWNENDTTSSSYIQNRTHYTEDPITTEVWTYSSSDTSTYREIDISNNNSWFKSLSDGIPYSIVFNGTTYTGNLMSDGGEGYVLGNGYIWGYSETDSGEPFVLGIGEYGIGLGISESYTFSNLDISLSITTSNIHKLDSKYLDGSLIMSGKGKNSEIFNGITYDHDVPSKQAIGNQSHIEGADGNSQIGFYLSGKAGDVTYKVKEFYYNYKFEQIIYGKEIFLNYGDEATGALIESSDIDVSTGIGTITLSKTLDENNDMDSEFGNIYISSSVAIGIGSHVEGNSNMAVGDYSHSEGSNNLSYNNNSHSEGNSTKSIGQGSHSEGTNTIANSNYSHAEGMGTIANGYGSHSEGNETYTLGSYSHAEGQYYDNATIGITLSGDANATTYNVISDTNGLGLPRDYFIGAIYNNTKSRITSLTKSNGIITKIQVDHTLSDSAIENKQFYFGFGGVASGNASHVEGKGSVASGNTSHAEGWFTLASGDKSHSEGWGTLAYGTNQHVQGKYNIEDTSNTYAHIVGNGNSTTRSNAHTLDWSGNGWYAGKLTVGVAPTNDMDVATKKYVDDNAGGGGSSTLVDLTDTTISSPTNGQVLMYNSTSGKWENTSLPIYNGGVSS